MSLGIHSDGDDDGDDDDDDDDRMMMMLTNRQLPAVDGNSYSKPPQLCMHLPRHPATVYFWQKCKNGIYIKGDRTTVQALASPCCNSFCLPGT